MNNIRRSWDQILLLILSLLGAGIAIYLTAVHYENAPLVCSTRGVIDCARVLSSAYSVVPGTTMPISVPGLGWCAVSAALAIVGWRLLRGQRLIYIVQFVWLLLGMLTVLYLVYVEVVLLHTICVWCTALHFVILVMFLITLVQIQRATSEPEPETEEQEVPTTPTPR